MQLTLRELNATINIIQRQKMYELVWLVKELREVISTALSIGTMKVDIPEDIAKHIKLLAKVERYNESLRPER